MIFRTVFRETCSSRQISLIVLPRTKNSRRTLAIVSTPFIPHPPIQFKGRAGLLELTKGGQFWTPIPPLRGSTFHADPHMIEIAKRQSGRVAVVVPHGVLFRGGAEGRIRQQLIEENLLDAVVGLPANLFTTTGIPVAILVFDRSREEGGANAERRDVLFIDASKEFTPGKTQNVMDEAHVAKVLETYGTRAEVERYSHLASPEEIAENGYNLNIPRYVDTFEPEEEIDVAAVQKDIVRIEAELAEVRAKMTGYLKELGVDA